MKKVRVRYAPSPTGHLHIGNARTALFNYLFAKHNNGDFIVRIEDTDLERNIERGEESQLNNLKWLGLSWDESIDKEGDFGPYNQLKRHGEGIYQKYADVLLERELAYRCFCTSEELSQEAELQKKQGEIPRYSGKCRNLSSEEINKKLANNQEFSVRLKVEKNKTYEWNDLVKGTVSFNSNDVSGDFNILKKNTIPTYNYAVVIDDYLMEISHVLRGEDHISNTPKQLMVYEALDFVAPEFGHMTLIVNETGKKLSKRDTEIVQFIEDYKNFGYLPEALFNFITLLGWSPTGEQEIYTKDEFIDIFDVNRLSKSAARFDKQKLNWINNEYLKKLELREYLDFVMPFVEYKKDVYSHEYIEQVVALYQEQLTYAKELNELITIFINDDKVIDQMFIDFIKTEGSVEVIKLFSQKIDHELSIDSLKIKEIIKEVQKESGIKGKALFMSIRIATTFQMHGPDLTTSLSILGKEKIIENINFTLSKLNEN